MGEMGYNRMTYKDRKKEPKYEIRTIYFTYIKISKFDQEPSSIESEKLLGARKENKTAHRDPEVEKVIELGEGQSVNFARGTVEACGQGQPNLECPGGRHSLTF